MCEYCEHQGNGPDEMMPAFGEGRFAELEYDDKDDTRTILQCWSESGDMLFRMKVNNCPMCGRKLSK